MTIYASDVPPVGSKVETRAAYSPEAQGRIPGLDFARGLAILGMIGVHFLMVLQPELPSSFRTLDLLDGRPTALFMLLAGISLTLTGGRATPEFNARGIAVKRGLFLLLVGMANLVLWPGDILRVYGVIFLLSSVLLARSIWSLLGISAGFMTGFMVLLFTLDYGQNWDWDTLTYQGLWTWSGVFRNLLFDGFRGVFPWAGVFVLGIAAGRLSLRDRRVQWAAIVGGLVVWALAEFVSAGLLRRILSQEWVAGDPEMMETMVALFGTGTLPPQPFFMASALGFASVLIGCSLRLPQSLARTVPFRAVQATGQMAFTWYLAHVYLGVFVLVALGWTTSSESTALGITGGYFVAITALSLWWRSRGGRGPLETIARRLTNPAPERN